MIAKIGNILWVPKVNTDTRGFMMIAFDTSKANGKNIISCVGTANESFSNFFAKSGHYSDNTDKFNEMVKLSFQAITFSAKKNSKNPKEVIIFHNSCTEDQASLFRDFFLNGLKRNL